MLLKAAAIDRDRDHLDGLDLVQTGLGISRTAASPDANEAEAQRRSCELQSWVASKRKRKPTNQQAQTEASVFRREKK